MENRPVSILTLQILFFYDFYVTWIYLVLGLIIFISKNATYCYPPYTLASEVVGLLLMTVLQFSRISIGSMGNKAESVSSIAWLIGLGIPNILIIVYYLSYQTFMYFLYSFYVDLVNNIILLFFVGLETIIGLGAFMAFKRAHSKN
jgi:Predicted membrane protein